jgi:tRNA1Val (adenine37-N6)-methyltransferase
LANSDIFQFQQFSVFQSNEVFKVGTDGVILGAWLDLKGDKLAVDLGCGTGLVSLIAAQRNEQINIIAMDHSESAELVCKKNFRNSPWSERLAVRKADLSRSEWPIDRKLDHLFSNPPFFHGNLRSKSKVSARAKHVTGLTYKHLLFHARKYLKDGAKLSCIYPVSLEEEVLRFADDHGYALARLWRVASRKESRDLRFLAEWRYGAEEITLKTGRIILYKSQKPSSRELSDQWAEMTRELYVKKTVND